MDAANQKSSKITNTNSSGQRSGVQTVKPKAKAGRVPIKHSMRRVAKVASDGEEETRYPVSQTGRTELSSSYYNPRYGGKIVDVDQSTS